MGSRVEKRPRHPDFVSLAMLMSRELRSEKMEKPSVKYGCSAQSRKGEDYFLMKTGCQRVHGDSSTSFSVFGIFDGHNGDAAAIYSRDNLLNHVLDAIPHGLNCDEWLQALPRALVAGFVKTDKQFQSKGLTSGTTATFVIVDKWTVTVASVGDSRCILDTPDGVVSVLTVDHRLEENTEERERVTASGGEVGRLNVVGGPEIGPLRCWPGGLCLSRSIGDMDVGEFIVPIPYVKQVKLSNGGGRLIIASDGIWDALSSESAAKSCRGLPAELAARQVVKEALRTRGLKDDTTCIVVDIVPPDNSMPHPSPPPKQQSKLRSLLFRTKFRGCAVSKLSKKLSAVCIVEELFEEGSAMLAERMASNKWSWVLDNYKRIGEVTVWDWQWKNKPITGEAWVEFMQLLALLRDTRMKMGQDGWGWHYENKSTFNVKTVREDLCVTSRDLSSGFVMTWNGWATPKANMLAWKGVEGRLPTKTKLEKRGNSD